jgi:drug/metabolite transporter (DMT)-like permease
LASAVSYGTSDFVGGLLSARSNPRAIAIVGQAIGGLIIGIVALSIGVRMNADAWFWSIAAAIGSSAGIVFLYRGLSRGRMSVVAPLSGIGAAALPVIVGFADGERPGPWAVAGLVAAVPAILMVAHVRDASSGPSGWPDGLLAGVGFGLGFLSIARLPHASGLAGVSLMQLLGALLISVTLVGGGAGAYRLQRSFVLGAAVTGVLSGAAVYLFQIATHHGYLSETAVLAALYPAVTVVLALIVLRERVTAIQVTGFALCAAAIGLIVSG